MKKFLSPSLFLPEGVVLVMLMHVLLSGCVDQELMKNSASSENAIEQVTSSQAIVQLTFFDSKNFDTDLSSFMKSGYTDIIVKPVVPFSMNEIPERLDVWFAKIKSGDRSIVAYPQSEKDGEAERVIPIAMVLKVGLGAFKAYEAIKEKLLYEPAVSYDASLIYDRKSGNVEEIIFSRAAE